MAERLSLRVTDTEDGAKQISWFDAQPEGNGPNWAFVMGFPVTFFVMMSIEDGYHAGEFLGSVLVMMFGGWIPGCLFYVVAKGFSGTPKHRKLLVYPDRVKSRAGTIPISDVSRIEYSKRGDWDRSDLSAVGRTQIRIWDRDRKFIVVAENNWTTAVNHEIHGTIQDVISAMKKSAPPTPPAEPKSSQPTTKKQGGSDFGMPDY